MALQATCGKCGRSASFDANREADLVCRRCRTYPPPRCCGDEMVPIEERTGFLLFFTSVRVVGYLCVWCEREAGPGEPERQWIASWAPLRVPSTNIRVRPPEPANRQDPPRPCSCNPRPELPPVLPSGVPAAPESRVRVDGGTRPPPTPTPGPGRPRMS